MGLGNMPLLWRLWDEGILPCETDASIVESVDLEEYRAIELCTTAAHAQISKGIFLDSTLIPLTLPGSFLGQHDHI